MWEYQHGALIVGQVACLDDNYGYLVHDTVTGTTAAVDTPDADALAAALDDRGWSLDLILNTHWHKDHTGGNAALVARTGANVVSTGGEGDKITGIDRVVAEGDRVTVGSAEARVIDVPGHTKGHIAFVFEREGIAFVADTLFSLGCGRMFEGTADEFWGSLLKLRALPPETVLYCAHEYTIANSRFARHVDPDNAALAARVAEAEAQRAAGNPTVPTRLAEEAALNPFLRADDPEMAALIGKEGASGPDVFAALRAAKDGFR